MNIRSILRNIYFNGSNIVNLESTSLFLNIMKFRRSSIIF
jgi:hypothetical protein